MRRTAFGVLLAVVVAMVGATHVGAVAQCVWSGAGSNSNWSNPDNWVRRQAPRPGNALVFPAQPSSFLGTNDEANGMAFDSLTFEGTRYTLSGNSITLAHGITVTVSGSNTTLNLGLTFTGSEAIAASGYLNVTGPVAISSGTLTLTSGDTLFRAAVSGNGGITAAKSAEAGLLAGNTYAGPTLVKPGGMLGGEGASAFGSASSGTTVDAGGTLFVTGGPIPEPITLDTTTGSGSPTLTSNQGADLTGPIRLVGGGQVDIQGGTLTLDGPISGPASILIRNVVGLNSSRNTFSGAITVGNGFQTGLAIPTDFLDFRTPAALGRTQHISLVGGVLVMCSTPSSGCSISTPVTLSGGTLQHGTGTDDTLTGPVSLESAGGSLSGVVLSGTLSGSGPLMIVDNVVSTLSGNNTFTGSVEVGGTLRVSGAQALGADSNRVDVENCCGRLELVGLSSFAHDVVLLGPPPAGPSLEVMCSAPDACGTLTDVGSISIEDAYAPADGAPSVIAVDSGETMVIQGSLIGDAHQNLQLRGPGLVDIPGEQSFAGTLGAGHVAVGGPASIDSAASVRPEDLLVSGPGTFSIPIMGEALVTGFPGIENVSGDTVWTGPAYAPAVQVDSGSVTLDVVADYPNRSSSLVETGAGVLTLTGSTPNTNSNPDYVYGGTLLLDKSPGVTAAPEGFLVESGPSGSPAAVRVESPNPFGPTAVLGVAEGGTFDLNGNNASARLLTMHGGTLSARLEGGASYQLCSGCLSVTQGVDLIANPMLSLSAPDGLVPGMTFVIVSNASQTPVNGTFRSLSDGAIFNSGGYQWAITYHGGDGNDVQVTVLGPTAAPLGAV
jgi:fibronectin-binding autotransporter adhesin